MARDSVLRFEINKNAIGYMNYISIKKIIKKVYTIYIHVYKRVHVLYIQYKDR